MKSLFNFILGLFLVISVSCETGKNPVQQKSTPAVSNQTPGKKPSEDHPKDVPPKEQEEGDNESLRKLFICDRSDKTAPAPIKQAAVQKQASVLAGCLKILKPLKSSREMI